MPAHSIKMPAQILLECLAQLYLVLIQRVGPRNYGDELVLLQTDQILTHMYIVVLQGEAPRNYGDELSGSERLHFFNL
jgi:hypothetical protein